MSRALVIIMTSKIVKTTTKGQITLPKQWRGQFNTDDFLMLISEDKIVLKTIKLDEIERESVIFDADCDNGGKVISPEEMIKMLKRIK